MTAATLALHLVDSALAELTERAERMSSDQLQAELDTMLATGRSSAGDLVVSILSRELTRRDEEKRS
jgi:hypothetical protein